VEKCYSKLVRIMKENEEINTEKTEKKKTYYILLIILSLDLLNIFEQLQSPSPQHI